MNETVRIPLKPSPEQKREEFVKFVQRKRYSIETKDRLELAVELLVVARSEPGDQAQLARACDANSLQAMMVLGFLVRQGLMECNWEIYKPLPGAIDEFLYRLANDGRASWVEPEPPPVIDPHAEARREAKGKLKAALKSAGYRREGDVRLRVVK
jgi:hypothetical protein